MRHTREEVIVRTIREFELLDHLVANLTDEDWGRLLPQPETKDPWTVKDALAHITHWKADVMRAIKRQPIPPEERGLNIYDGNNLVYLRWHARSPQEVLAWHRQVHQDVLAALKEAPEAWFSGRERRADWPFDLDEHSAYHRVKDIERALKKLDHHRMNKLPNEHDPLPWLLEPENPSVRFWALHDLLDRPADDPELVETRQAIAEQPLVNDLFTRQQPGGYWGDESKPHNADGAGGVLNLLYMLGVPPDPRTALGCDSFLRFCQHAQGGFSMIKQQRSGIFPCTTGQHLPFLVYFGFGEDVRLRAAFDYLIHHFMTDEALDCGRYQHRGCLWGAIAALNGLAVLPAALRTAQSAQVVQRLANVLLDAPYDFAGEHKRWLTFGVPRGWDLLSALKTLAAHGYARHPRFTPLLQRVLDLQDPEGRWRCGSASRTYPIEKRNQPSKWVTLDVLRVLKMAEV